ETKEVRDYSKALSYYKKAADGGHIESNAAIGYMCRHGKGVEYDINAAAKWYGRCGCDGNSRLLEGIITNFLNNIKCPEDFSASLVWYIKAAELGSPQVVGVVLDEYIYRHSRNPKFSFLADLIQG